MAHADTHAVLMGLVEQWPSLAGQLDLACRIFGEQGPHKVEHWVDEQIGFIGNSEFARRFSDHLDLPGIRPAEYAHRRIRSAHGRLLGGIRFYSRNPTRPFVDVLAHDFDDVDALEDCVFAEWSNFDVRFLRLRTSPGMLACRADVILDKSIHAARCRDMSPGDGRVTLGRFDTAESAQELIAERYSQVARSNHPLRNNLSPAEPDDLRKWHERGQLWSVHAGLATVGVFAVAPGSIGWITGQEINEEVVGVAHSGRRLAVSAQCAWAHGWAVDTGDLLIGTIDRHNHPSRATALRAGRPRVLDDVFGAGDAAPTT